MHVVRVYHAGRDPGHRARERALLRAGVDVTLVVPRSWPGPSAGVGTDAFEVIELDVVRPGNVNQHRWKGDLVGLVTRLAPDVLDVHEEPVSLAAAQWTAAAGGRPVVMYSAQNLDKRWPPPFAGYERAALNRVAVFYTCSRQAASVLRGKGFSGRIEVLPLGIDPQLFVAGDQQLPAEQVVLLFAGRFVSEKGALDALEVLAAVRAEFPARLILVGTGPQKHKLVQRAAELRLEGAVEWRGWVDGEHLAGLYRRAHVVLLPSRATSTWTEQFGRVAVEGWSSGAVPVAYASGSLSEVIGDGGIVVAEGDLDALCQAVMGLMRAPNEWQRRRATEPGGFATWAEVARRQADMYALSVQRPAHRHPTGRSVAREEFGQPARTAVSDRPLALPVLRNSKTLHRLLRHVGQEGS